MEWDNMRISKIRCSSFYGLLNSFDRTERRLTSAAKSETKDSKNSQIDIIRLPNWKVIRLHITISFHFKGSYHLHHAVIHAFCWTVSSYDVNKIWEGQGGHKNTTRTSQKMRINSLVVARQNVPVTFIHSETTLI